MEIGPWPDEILSVRSSKQVIQKSWPGTATPIAVVVFVLCLGSPAAATHQQEAGDQDGAPQTTESQV